MWDGSDEGEEPDLMSRGGDTGLYRQSSYPHLKAHRFGQTLWDGSRWSVRSSRCRAEAIPSLRLYIST